MSDRRASIATVLVTLGLIAMIVGIGVTAFVAGRAARTVDEVDERVADARDRGDREFHRAGLHLDTPRAVRDTGAVGVVECGQALAGGRRVHRRESLGHDDRVAIGLEDRRQVQ